MIRYEMQRITGFVGLLILLAAFSACWREEKVSSNQIVIGQITSAVTLDPHLVNEESTHSTLTHFYSRLVVFGPEMDLQPDLAVRWESLSDTVWRLQLREGVVFHDGRPFEAQDAVASILRAQRLDNYYVQPIEHVYAVDHQTVEVQTYDPFPVLLNRLASVYIVPRNTALTPIDHPLGTGPYRFVSGVPNGTIEGERFLRFWGPPPAFDRVTILPLSDPTERAEAVSSGKTDLANNFPLEFYQWGLKQQNNRIVSRAGLGVVLLGFSMTQGSPFADLRVRQAVSLALDREKIIGNEPQPLAVPMHQIVPPGIFGYSSELRPFVYDKGRADLLLKEAGFSKGLQAELHLPNSLEDLVRHTNQKSVGRRKYPLAFEGIAVERLLPTIQRQKTPTRTLRVVCFDRRRLRCTRCSAHAPGWNPEPILILQSQIR